MITIVCCIGNRQIFNLRLGKSLQGHDGEYILISPDIKLTLPQAYNSIDVNKITTKYILFAHEDIYFYDPNWIKKIERSCDKRENMGVAGFAGIKVGGGAHNAVGHIDHWGSRGIRKGRGWGDARWDNKVVRVQTVDSLGFVVPTKVFKKYKFSEEFPFHMMTEDYCLTLKYIHNLGIYIIPLRVWHNEAGLGRHQGSGGMVNLAKWHRKLYDKWCERLSGIGIYCTSVAYGIKKKQGKKGYCPECGGDIQLTPAGYECRVCHRKVVSHKHKKAKYK